MRVDEKFLIHTSPQNTSDHSLLAAERRLHRRVPGTWTRSLDVSWCFNLARGGIEIRWSPGPERAGIEGRLVTPSDPESNWP